MNRLINYLHYILLHKYWVFVFGRQLKVPILQLIFHDWTKFLPDEFFPYMKTFYKENGEKQYLKTDEFKYAWNLHQKRNKHHWQFWVMEWDMGETEILEIPHNHLLELLADWAGASKMHNGNPKDYYSKFKDAVKFHPKTRELFELLLYEHF